MERITHMADTETGYLSATENLSFENSSYTGPAIQRLAQFENYFEDLNTTLAQTAEKLEQLRADGKKNSVQFRELLAKKLTASNALALLQTYGLK